MVYPGCERCTPWYIPGYATYLPWCIYHYPGYTTPVPPWVYLHPTMLATGTMVSTLAAAVPGEEALGSKEENPLGRRPLRVLESSFLLGLIGNDAQSYSVS